MPFSPVRIYNIFLDEIQLLPDVSFTACLIGPVLPLVNREFKKENSYYNDSHYYYNFIYNSDEQPVAYDLYISPKTKRQYVNPVFQMYFTYQGKQIFLNENEDYIVEYVNNRVKLLNISSGHFRKKVGQVQVISCQGNICKVNSIMLGNGIFLENGFVLIAGPVSAKITDIIDGTTLSIDTPNIPAGIYNVYIEKQITIDGDKFTIDGITFKAIYRVFKIFEDENFKPIAIKIDNVAKIKQLLAPDGIDKENILAYYSLITIRSMPVKKAIYVIPLRQQNNYMETLDAVKKLLIQGNVIPYELAFLTFNEEDIESLINFIDEMNAPQYSNPTRCWVTYDLPLYKYDWRIWNDYPTSDDYDYLKILETHTINTKTFNNHTISIKLDTTPTINSNNYLVFTNSDKSFAIIVKASNTNINSDTITFIVDKIEYIVGGKLSFDNFNSLTTLYVTTLDTNGLMVNENAVYYSPKISSLGNIINEWINKVNNERVNIVNPWLITNNDEYIPGFYLIAARIGITVGTEVLSKPTSAEAMYRDDIKEVDYSINVFDAVQFQQLIDNGIDMCLIYDNILQSWLQRTSYKGGQIDRKYQNTIRALDYFNWRQKKIALRYVRKYALTNNAVSKLKTELELNIQQLKMNSQFGPVVGPNTKILRIVVVKDPSDIPPDIPVNLETGIIIVNKVELLRPWNETVIYNLITAH